MSKEVKVMTEKEILKLRLELLDAYGVDNWDGYDFAQEILNDEEPEGDDGTYSDTQVWDALDAAGVDNWDGYDEALDLLNRYLYEVEDGTFDGTYSDYEAKYI